VAQPLGKRAGDGLVCETVLRKTSYWKRSGMIWLVGVVDGIYMCECEDSISFGALRGCTTSQLKHAIQSATLWQHSGAEETRSLKIRS
jgi:hypothetical protein